MEVRAASVLGVCIIIAGLIVTMIPRPQPAAPGPTVNRFQMGGVPGHAYVLDTATGQVWEDFATTGQGSSHPDFNKPKLK